MTLPEDSRRLLSVVVPCHNEAPVIEATHQRLLTVLEPLEEDYEILYVDDGSTDDTFQIMEKLRQSNAHIRVLQLARNFGHQVASSAGVDHAAGDAVILIDADLQDPPEVIPQMIALWRQGAEVVYGRRRRRQGETVFKAWTAKFFYRLMDRLSEVAMPTDTGDFRLMDRSIADVIREMPEHHRFLRGMVSWVGFRQVPVVYDRQPRAAGRAKYSIRRMVSFALDGIVSFSLLPLRLATLMGLGACLLSLLLGFGLALGGSASRLSPSSWLLVALLLLGGVQLVCLGILGEYLGRTHREVMGRPHYTVRRRQGFPPRTKQDSVGGESV